MFMLYPGLCTLWLQKLFIKLTKLMPEFRYKVFEVEVEKVKVTAKNINCK